MWRRNTSHWKLLKIERHPVIPRNKIDQWLLRSGFHFLWAYILVWFSQKWEPLYTVWLEEEGVQHVRLGFCFFVFCKGWSNRVKHAVNKWDLVACEWKMRMKFVRNGVCLGSLWASEYPCDSDTTLVFSLTCSYTTNEHWIVVLWAGAQSLRISRISFNLLSMRMVAWLYPSWLEPL